MGLRAEAVRDALVTLWLMQARGRDLGLLLIWVDGVVIHICLLGRYWPLHPFDCVGKHCKVRAVVCGCDLGRQWWEGHMDDNVIIIHGAG